MLTATHMLAEDVLLGTGKELSKESQSVYPMLGQYLHFPLGRLLFSCGNITHRSRVRPAKHSKARHSKKVALSYK